MYTLDSRFTDASEGMFYTYQQNNKSKFLEINKAFVYLMGIPKSELLAADPDTIFAPDSLKKLQQKKARLTQKGYLFSEEHLLGRNGVKLNVEIHSSKIRWGQKDIYFHVVKEVSEKKWIASQVRNKPVLASGILDHQMKISNIYNHYEPLPFVSSDKGILGSSLASLIEKSDLLKVRRSFAKAIEYRQEKQVTFQISELSAGGAVKMKASMKPLVNGSNEVTKVAFVLCRAEATEEATEVFSPLMLAAL
jgi:PAS domain S-box-containing protein